MIWTLKYNGAEKTLAAWGVRNIKRALVSQDIDTVTFDQPHATALSDPLFAEGGIVEIFRDDGAGKKRWFYGRAEDAAPFKSGRSAGLSYTISGPWWWLANMGFRQSWKVRRNGVLVDQFSSYCMLGTRADGFGTQQSIADQIAEAVNYAISQNAPLAFDAAGLPTIFPPVCDVWNASVAEVIRKMIDWTPDIVCWFDYSTDPLPTLKMRRRADQQAVTLGLRGSIADLQIRPRNDLKVLGAIVYYLRTDSTNGITYGTITEDKYPNVDDFTGREPKALLAAINLTGASSSYTEGSITCELIEAESATWWAKQDPHLVNVKDLKIKAGSATYTDENGNAVSIADTPFKLIGQWAPWMGGTVRTLNVSAKASYSELLADGSGNALTVVDRQVFAQIEAANLQTGVYRSTQEAESGEGQPIGLAEALVTSRNTLHFEGRLTLKQQDCAGAINMGNVLNISGGRADWAAMTAQIQSVLEEIDSGSTTVSFGPPRILGPNDYVELLRATRNRIRFAAAEARTSGVMGGSFAQLGQTVSKQVASNAQGGITQQVWIDPNLSPALPAPAGDLATRTPGAANLDLRELDGKTASWVEVERCIKNELWYMKVFGTAAYKK
jgi:hypothetical protein